MRILCVIGVYLIVFVQPLFAVEEPLAGVGLKAFSILLIIIVVLFAGAWALKRYGPVARVRKSLGLDILGQVALSTKATLALVKVGSSILLLGVTSNSVSLVKDLGEGNFEQTLKNTGLDGDSSKI
ncbi:MAG: flagellar biosynthetic protein FliO [Deltaproteobacteria bacterium]|nr:flagellar biosynthetic protein FliO [Deltaproteobacteria bacterium]